MKKENWDVKVLGWNETMVHFHHVRLNPDAATAHYWVKFIDHEWQADHASPNPIPVLTFRVNDIHPGQDGVLFADRHAEEALAFAREHKMGEEFSRVLVQCAAGISRSTATAIALLVNAGFTPEEAFAKIEKVRPILHPNKWIIEVFDRVMGNGGAMMKYYAQWYNDKRALHAFTHVPPHKIYTWDTAPAISN